MSTGERPPRSVLPPESAWPCRGPPAPPLYPSEAAPSLCAERAGGRAWSGVGCPAGLLGVVPNRVRVLHEQGEIPFVTAPNGRRYVLPRAVQGSRRTDGAALVALVSRSAAPLRNDAAPRGHVPGRSRATARARGRGSCCQDVRPLDARRRRRGPRRPRRRLGGGAGRRRCSWAEVGYLSKPPAHADVGTPLRGGVADLLAVPVSGRPRRGWGATRRPARRSSRSRSRRRRPRCPCRRCRVAGTGCCCPA